MGVLLASEEGITYILVMRSFPLNYLECISVLNIYQLELSVNEVIEKERNPLQTIIAETESEAKMKIRIGQQKYIRYQKRLY